MREDAGSGTRMGGALQGNDIGAGTYTLCIDALTGPHQPWSTGSLAFTRDDCLCTFTLHVAIMRLSNYQARATYQGTYELDPTGTFAGSQTSLSGLLELSQPSRFGNS